MTEGESKIFIEGEALLEPNEQDEFNTLRKKQLKGELSPEERNRYLELQEKEAQARQNRDRF